jgi:ribonuclease T2
VGIAGWSLGGGHGPFAPQAGLGVDNVLEVVLVTANGTAVIANSTHNKDLWWAVRGGGGSTWGVVTAFTLRLHAIPAGGFQKYILTWSDNLCDKGYERVMKHYLDWAQQLGCAWGGLAFLTMSKSKAPGDCGGKWRVLVDYMYTGSSSEADPLWEKLAHTIPNHTSNTHTHYNNTWEYEQSSSAHGNPSQGIYVVVPWMPNSVPSVLVHKEKVADGSMLAAALASADTFINGSGLIPTISLQIYQDITGNIGSPQPSTVSVNPGMRSAMLHVVSSVIDEYSQLGEHAYFSESAYAQLGSWQDRYWGKNNYARLLDVKRMWDPHGVFWCRHCVGDA